MSTIKFNAQFDGELLGPIIMDKGLRQGDLLSLYLFIICAEGLSQMLQNREQRGMIQGVKLQRVRQKFLFIFC